MRPSNYHFDMTASDSRELADAVRLVFFDIKATHYATAFDDKGATVLALFRWDPGRLDVRRGGFPDQPCDVEAAELPYPLDGEMAVNFVANWLGAREAGGEGRAPFGDDYDGTQSPDGFRLWVGPYGEVFGNRSCGVAMVKKAWTTWHT